MLRLPLKCCPSCDHRITLREFSRFTSPVFSCPQCSTKLEQEKKWFVPAAVVGALLMAYPISLAVDNPWYWLLVVGSWVPIFFVYFAFFGVRQVGV